MTKTVLITGAAKRIGRHLALGLATDGWQVAIHYARSKIEAESLKDEINALGQKAACFQADLDNVEAVQALTQRVTAEMGAFDALINNASVFERDRAISLTPESWDLHLNVNLRAPAILMTAFAKQADANADIKDGNIINIIDQRVWRLTPDFISYTVAKTGLWTLTQTYAMALAAQNIRVNAIGPGPTLPNTRQSKAEFDQMARLVPLGHGATMADILDGVRYILNAKAMTGQMIALDGGQHLAWQTPDITQVKE